MKRNWLIAACAAMVVVLGGYTLLRSSASSFFAGVDPENATLTTNAKVISDSGASGGKAVQFTAAVVTPPPTGGGGGGGGTTPPVSTCQAGTKPSASNTGVPVGTSLTVVNGDLTVTTAGTVVDGKDVHGFIIIKANNVTIQNSIVRGRATSTNANLVQMDNVTGTVIKNSELANGTPSPLVDGMSAQNATISCNNIHGTVDGMKAGSGTTIQYNYIHDLSYLASDPNQGGGPTHNDDIQILSGSGITITGNTLLPTDPNGNSAIQITEDYGVPSNVHINSNWMDGGQCTLNAGTGQTGNNKGPYTINADNNRFGRHSFFNCPILIGTKITLVGSGNVWDDTSQAVSIQQHD